MNKKICFISATLIIIMLFQLIYGACYAVNKDVILEEAENNVCEINMGEDGKLVKKLVSVDDSKKEVILQVDVTNLKNEEQSIEPSEIFLVIDNSKSMTDNTLSDGTTRKEAVFTAAKSLVHSILTAQSTTKIGIVSFSTSSDSSKEGTIEDASLVIAPTSTEEDIVTAIDSIETNGVRTNIDAGLQVAKSSFSQSTELNQYLILLTDGVPNTAVGGPTMTYSGEVTTKTKATLKSITDSGINIVTVMTGVDSEYQPDPNGVTSAEAAGKTYKDLAEEIFGTEDNPNYGKFYYVTDDNAVITITTEVYSDVIKVIKNEINNITVVDYFPDDIIANYDFEIVEKENIGIVTSTVNTENNSITWTIEKLKAAENASFKYKLVLKENYNENILNVVMSTNKKVDVTYTGVDGVKKTVTSEVSPKIVLKGENLAPDPIPQTGELEYLIMAAIIGVCAIAVLYFHKYKKSL